MRCESCGREIVDTAIRCYHCGAKVGVPVQMPATPIIESADKTIESALDDVILMSSGAFEKANLIVEERKREIDLMRKKVNEESESANERLKHIRTREGILRRKEEELKALETKKKEVEERISYLEKKEDELKSMETRLQHLENEIVAEKNRIEGEIRSRDQTIATLEVEEDKSKREMSRLFEVIKEKDRDITRARSGENELTATLRQRITALEAESDEKRKTRIGQDLEVMNLQEKLKETENRLRDRESRIDTLIKERAALKEESRSLQEKMETITKWSESISSKLKSAETTIPALANARLVLEQRVNSLEGNLKWKDAQLNDLQTMQNALPLLQKAKSTLEDRVNQLEGELHDRDKWVRESNALKQKITSLTEEKAGIEKRIQGMESENISLKQEMMLLKKTIASSHEQVEKEKLSSAQAAKERDTLKEELAASNRAKGDIESRTRTLSTETERARNDLEFAKRLVSDKDNELSNVHAKVKTLENQVEALRGTIKETTKERDDLLSEVDELYGKQDSSSNEMDDIKRTVESQKRRVLELEGFLSGEKRRAVNAEDELRLTQKALADQKESLEKERALREEIVKVHSKEVEELRKEIDVLTKSGEHLKGKERAGIEAEGLKARIASLDGECAALRKANSDLQATLMRPIPTDGAQPQVGELKKREMFLTSELERYKNEAAMRNEEMERLKAETGSLRKRATELLDASKIQVEERRRFQDENEEMKRTFDSEHELRIKTENAMKRAVADLNALQDEAVELRQLKSVMEVERQRLGEKEKELADLEVAFAKQTKEIQRERDAMERERGAMKEKSDALRKKEQDLQEFVTETFLVESKGDKKKGKASQKAIEAKLAAAFDMAGKGSKPQKDEHSTASVDEMQEYVSKVIFEYEKKLDSLSEQTDSMRRELEERRKENLRLKSMLQEFVSPQEKR
jgi:DNA repair protein RAD50